jgi:chemotaxis protein methyltransferase CheR
MSQDSPAERLIADVLTQYSGQQMTDSRSWRIAAALSGLYRKKGIANADHLARLLLEPGQAQLTQEVVDALLNNETYFFRDRVMFDQISAQLLPRLAQQCAKRKRLSILCAGCSTGQEPLSLAMLLLDQRAQWADWQIDIVGTDVSHSAIASAHAGVYSQFEIQRGLSVQHMLTYFTETGQGWECNAELRAMVRYRTANILDARPSEPYDLVLCRNVLLYFDTATRQRAFDRLFDLLAPDGWLILGAGETVRGYSQRFQAVDWGINMFRPARRSLSRRVFGALA